MAELSNEMEIDLQMKYVAMCGKNDVRNSLGNDGDSDDSDGDDLETYNGFVGNRH